RAMAHIHALSSLAAPIAPLVNAVGRSTVGRWLNEQLLGIDRRRTPPPFVRDTFRHRSAKAFAGRAASDRSAKASAERSAILFVDTFTNFNHPDIGVAAIDVLRAAGTHPRVVPHGCCGRPMISKGLLDDA